MPPPVIAQDHSFEGQPVTHMARITGLDGANITQSSLSSIQLRIFDDDGNVIDTRSLVVGTVVFDTLQQTADDARWTLDAVGFNFLNQTLMNDLPSGDKVYRFEYRFRPVNQGGQFHLVRDVVSHNILTTSG